MALTTDTIRGVGERLNALTQGCIALTTALESEVGALGAMDLSRMNALAGDRDGALESVISADATLRRALAEAAREVGIPVDQVLRVGPLAEAVREQRAALIAQRDVLQRTAERVQVRAAHGLAFFRSVLGTPQAYGAHGAARDLGPGPTQFYRVM